MSQKCELGIVTRRMGAVRLANVAPKQDDDRWLRIRISKEPAMATKKSRRSTGEWLTPTEQERWEAEFAELLPVSQRHAGRLTWRFHGLLNEHDILDASFIAVLDTIHYKLRAYDPRRGTIEAIYVRIAKRRILDLLYDKGYVKCANCNGRSCSQCYRGWKTGHEVHIKDWEGIAEDLSPLEGVDHLRAFQWAPSWWEQQDERTRSIISRIKSKLNHRQRIIWWADVMGQRHILTDEDLAERFCVAKSAIRKDRERAWKRVKTIIAE